MTETTPTGDERPTLAGNKLLAACPWCGALVVYPGPPTCPHCGHDTEVPPAICTCDICELAHPVIDAALDDPTPLDVTLLIGCTVFAVTDGLDRYGYGARGKALLRPWHPLNSRRQDTLDSTPESPAVSLSYVRP